MKLKIPSAWDSCPDPSYQQYLIVEQLAVPAAGEPEAHGITNQTLCSQGVSWSHARFEMNLLVKLHAIEIPIDRCHVYALADANLVSLN